jgi:hypothetical protein
MSPPPPPPPPNVALVSAKVPWIKEMLIGSVLVWSSFGRVFH